MKPPLKSTVAAPPPIGFEFRMAVSVPERLRSSTTRDGGDASASLKGSPPLLDIDQIAIGGPLCVQKMRVEFSATHSFEAPAGAGTRIWAEGGTTMNVAESVAVPTSGQSQSPVPLHAPLHPTNVAPESGTAVR